MTSREIIDGVMTSINVQIARRKRKVIALKEMAEQYKDSEMIATTKAQIQILERLEKDLIQIEMNEKISYMGIDVKGDEQ